jgi:hypothetical protein
MHVRILRSVMKGAPPSNINGVYICSIICHQNIVMPFIFGWVPSHHDLENTNMSIGCAQ